MVIGCCGAGKSTFARKLQSINGLPLVHLDQVYWHPHWVETEKEVWTKKMKELVSKPSWIIDGNYGGTMDIRLKEADTIFYLQYPTWKCLYRVIKRTIQYHGQKRPDMPEGCNERFSLEFLHYVATFNLVRTKSILTKLKEIDHAKSVFICRNDQELEKVLEDLRSKTKPQA
jgi:adenylate kinase family enzyme